MAINLYRWDDTSAPSLDGTVGSFTDLLDACLINGYGTRSAAGWAHAFTAGTNKAVYRNGTDAYYRVDDNAPSASNYADIRGYMSMTDNDTGLDSFPDTTIRAISSLTKSSVTSTVARNWVLVENNGMVFFSVDSVGNQTLDSSFIMFGKFNSFVAGDINNHLCLTSYWRNTSQMQATVFLHDLTANVTSNNNTANITWVSSDHSGLGTGVSAGIHAKYTGVSATGYIGSTGLAYPSPEEGAFHIVDGFYIGNRPYNSTLAADYDIRGEIRGLSGSLNKTYSSASWTGRLGDTFSNEAGTVDYIVMSGSTSGANYYMFVQLTDPWV